MSLIYVSELATIPTIIKISPNATSFTIEWLPPATDKFTGNISKYEICYAGDFDTRGCIEIGAAYLRWNVTELHPYVRYELKMRSAALLGYGPYSPVNYATTLESGEEQIFLIIFETIGQKWSMTYLIDLTCLSSQRTSDQSSHHRRAVNVNGRHVVATRADTAKWHHSALRRMRPKLYGQYPM